MLNNTISDLMCRSEYTCKLSEAHLHVTAVVVCTFSYRGYTAMSTEACIKTVGFAVMSNQL